MQDPMRQNSTSPVPPSNQNNTKAVVALVLGVVAILFVIIGMFVPFISWAGVVAAIVGIVLGVQARKEGGGGMATAGLVVSIVALGITVFVIICAACLVGGALGIIGALG